MKRLQGNDLELGTVVGQKQPLQFPSALRSTHLYVCGSTGTGKSKFLEHLIRQDIRAWRNSKCGMLVLDPHGSPYDSLVRWLAWIDLKRPVIPIDLRRDDWVISYNVLRKRKDADPAVLINNFVQAMAHVWGQSGTKETPLFARWASNVLWALYEKQHTLVEAEYLIDRLSKQIRQALTEDLSNRALAQDWAYANTLPPKDFEAQISSTINRLHTFLSTQMLRRMFGQPGPSLDLRKALDEGDIILVNLATEKVHVSEEDSALFATLLLNDVWTAAKERGKGLEEGDVKPFYVYVDEFQNFVTPTIAKNLDQARGFGLHLTLANQFPRQILHSGANGAQVYDSVMANARSKVVFSVEGEENLKQLAQHLFMRVLDPDMIKHELYSTKVMKLVEETRTIHSQSENWSDGMGDFAGTTDTSSQGGSTEKDGLQWNTSNAASAGTSHTNMSGGGSSETTVPFIKQIMGKELSSREYRSLEEQLFRAMAALFDQKQRHGVVRLVEMRAPVSIVTPTVTKAPGSAERTKKYLDRCYAKLPFALPMDKACEQLAQRAQSFTGKILKEASDEPGSAKRKLPPEESQDGK